MPKFDYNSRNKCKYCNGSGREQDLTSTGFKMRKRRLEAGISIREMEKASGYSNSYLTMLERGRRAWTRLLKETYNAALKRCIHARLVKVHKSVALKEAA